MGSSHGGVPVDGHCLDGSVTFLTFQGSHKKRCENYMKVKSPSKCKGLLLLYLYD